MPASEDSNDGIVEQESEFSTKVETMTEDRQNPSDLKDLSINTELIENSYNRMGPAPRNSSVDLSLAYYHL